MSVEERVTQLERQTDDISEQDTIIPEFQNPDTCVFCNDKYYDSIIFELLRIYYNDRNGKEYEKLDKETCIHHKDKWLKHSHRTAGFIHSAFTNYGEKSMTGKEIEELFRNKEEREKLLTEFYDESMKFTCAAHLYLKVPPENKKNRYNNAFTIEDDIQIQNKIIRDKLKTCYTNALEVLQTLDDKKTLSFNY